MKRVAFQTLEPLSTSLCGRGVGWIGEMRDIIEWPLSALRDEFSVLREEMLIPEDSVRLRMLAYRLRVHHVRFVARLDALKSTQA